MATGRKYAGLLPDLDEDRDLFETPELTDDTSTRPPESDILDEEESEESEAEEISGISRHRLNADSARLQFHGSKVDARRADFSDRLDSKRKSYHITSRRLDSQYGKADASDTDDETPKSGLRRKVAQLLREAEELKAEMQQQHDAVDNDDEGTDAETMQQLSSAISILDNLRPATGGLSAQGHLAKQLSEASRSTIGQNSNQEQNKTGPTYTLSYQPSFEDSHALSIAASFDARLKELEGTLGLSAVPLPTQSDEPPKPLLPTLEVLEKQVELLFDTNPASLDSMSMRIRQLTDEAERLTEKRKAAKQSYGELRAAVADASAVASSTSKAGIDAYLPASGALVEDAETETKIAALYKTLPTIESLAPALPIVLERLKSLRLLHADAADAATRIKSVEDQNKEMREEIALWRKGLDKVEAAVGTSEQTTAKNMAVVEKWIQELEDRVKTLNVDK